MVQVRRRHRHLQLPPLTPAPKRAARRAEQEAPRQRAVRVGGPRLEARQRARGVHSMARGAREQDARARAQRLEAHEARAARGGVDGGRRGARVAAATAAGGPRQLPVLLRERAVVPHAWEAGGLSPQPAAAVAAGKALGARLPQFGAAVGAAAHLHCPVVDEQQLPSLQAPARVGASCCDLLAKLLSSQCGQSRLIVAAAAAAAAAPVACTAAAPVACAAARLVAAAAAGGGACCRRVLQRVMGTTPPPADDARGAVAAPRRGMLLARQPRMVWRRAACVAERPLARGAAEAVGLLGGGGGRGAGAGVGAAGLGVGLALNECAAAVAGAPGVVGWVGGRAARSVSHDGSKATQGVFHPRAST